MPSGSNYARASPAEVAAARLREKIERLRKQVRQLGELKEQLQGQAVQLSMTDPDARSMANVVGSGKTQAVCRCDIFLERGGERKLCAAAQGTIQKAE